MLRTGRPSMLVATVLVGSLLACHGGSPSGVTYARNTARDASRFASNDRASVTFARIGD